MVGRCFFDGVVGVGTVSSASLATHWCAPAGDSLELPLVGEQVLEEAVAPARRGVGPGDLEPAGDRVAALARPVGAVPPETLRLDRGGLRLGADVVAGPGAVGLAEGVATGDERDGLLVVHRHPAEGLADVAGGEQRVGVAVGALGVDVDQPHLDGPEVVGQLAVAAVALVAEPGVLGPPDDLLGLPDVLAAEAEAEGLEPHVLEGDVAGEHEQVGPRDLPAVLLLHRPQQAAGLVEVGVVGPAVQRSEPLRAVPGAAASVGDPVRAGGVPAHPDEERAVVAEVGRPPVLRGPHDLDDVLLERVDVERRRTPPCSRGRASGWTPARAGAARTGRAGWATSPCWCAADRPARAWARR